MALYYFKTLNMANYKKLLQHPQWQKKRLEIMSRDNFRCIRCNDDQNMLTVHHKYYNKKLMPWEYPDKCFETLCFNCHSINHKNEKDLAESIIYFLKQSEFATELFYNLAEDLMNIETIDVNKELLISAIGSFIKKKSNQHIMIAQYKNKPIAELLKDCLIKQY